jgi:23S rRNA (pseudouridine1915-N3)-methyltransferase
MFKLTILAVGALKEPFWKSAIAEYAKRLSAYAKMRVIEVSEEPFGSPTEAPTVLRAESEKLKKKIPDEAFTIALVKEGRALTTEKFAEALDREGQGGREIVFLIGGPLGLSSDLATACDLKLSLSSLTFTHGEARVVLYEQLYRAMTVLAGKTYHY